MATMKRNIPIEIIQPPIKTTLKNIIVRLVRYVMNQYERSLFTRKHKHIHINAKPAILGYPTIHMIKYTKNRKKGLK